MEHADASGRPHAAAPIEVEIAGPGSLKHLPAIALAIDAEVDRGAIGLARRSVEWLAGAVSEGRALIAVDGESWAGFCAIHAWEGGKFAATSALIVRPEWRRLGIAGRLKEKALELSLMRFPAAVPFGLTTSGQVAAINLRLGFREVPYSEITGDAEFWKGCETCRFFETLQANRRVTCHCKAMRR